MHICVLGAGVIGTTSAYRLLQAGHQVTLVDAMPMPAAGASSGNGAQLSYSYVAPLADPSVWTQWPHYLFSQNSPLTLRPQADLAQWRWLLQFLAASTRRQVQRTTIDLLRLAFFSRDQLAQLRTEISFDFLHRTAGKLVMFSDADALQDAEKQAAFQAEYGCRQQVLDLPRCWSNRLPEPKPRSTPARIAYAGESSSEPGTTRLSILVQRLKALGEIIDQCTHRRQQAAS
jgi:D-amino-acid dehydrogenase